MTKRVVLQVTLALFSSRIVSMTLLPLRGAYVQIGGLLLATLVTKRGPAVTRAAGQGPEWIPSAQTRDPAREGPVRVERAASRAGQITRDWQRG